jgi:peptide-methionine (S)-S-oxide reductase
LRHPRTAAKPASATAPAKPAAPVTTDRAVFAGGCFWSMERIRRPAGVTSVVSGYMGGAKLNPSYEEVSEGGTGHAESVEVLFDPRKVTYSDLLDLYWHNIDPTQTTGQFCDHGDQYRSVIFYRDSTQKRLAEASKRAIESTPQRFTAPIATKIQPAARFWPAEEYHQDFYKKEPDHYEAYRQGCGRDRRLVALWGKPGRHAAP